MSRSEIRFLLDGEEIRLAGVAPTTTLLNWLREQQGRTGTKEGCAEGDCGACTVVLASLEAGRLRWRAVNACIQFLPTLHGKALFTVESLRQPDGRLHPAQQAIVDYHGSQCGFCTPGFAMSLFGLYQNQPAASEAEVGDALSGNLCRCTGYRPLLLAGQQMYELPPALPARDDPELIARLQALNTDAESLELDGPAGRFHAPATLAELAALRQSRPDALILAGGTDVGLWVTKQLKTLPEIIALGQVAELKRIAVGPEAIEIGAAVTLEDAFAALLDDYPEFAELAARFASRPIRNAGTLVGNIANGSPIGDTMPALIALGTRIRLRRGASTRELPLDAFYLGYRQQDLAPGEFVEAALVPRRPAAPGFRFRIAKVSRRRDQDISAVFAALSLHLDADGRARDVRLAYGGMAAIPARAKQAEAVLEGQIFDAAAVATAGQALAQDFAPLSDVRASSAYRLAVAARLLVRFQLEMSNTRAGAPATRLYPEDAANERA